MKNTTFNRRKKRAFAYIAVKCLLEVASSGAQTAQKKEN